MQEWPWSVRASVRQGLLRREEVWLDLFRTRVHLYELTEQIATVRDGGLETAASRSPDMRLLLDLLYDEEEQTTTCDDGFRARPNLGCLLLADHLDEKLPSKAGGFLKAMKAAAGGGQERIPVIVAASVFGGTGASLLPIARRAVEKALARDVQPDQMRRFHWAAVKLLPHYLPAEKRDSVDPDRFLLDTSSALQFYSTVYDTTAPQARYDAMFVIGSDNPARNRVRTVLGHSRQANPAYFEELLAALAALRFAADRPAPDSPVRVYAPDAVTWENLPSEDRKAVREALGFLLHVGAFYLRRGSTLNTEQLSMGLARLLRNAAEADLMLFAWYKKVLDGWAEFHPTFKAAAGTERVKRLRDSASMQEHSFEAMLKPAGEYFGRLLLWAETALQGEDLSFMDHSATEDYADLYAAMAEVKAAEIDAGRGDGQEARTIQPAEDNGLVRLLRAAASAMVHEHNEPRRGLRRNPRFTLVEDGRIRLRTTSQQTEDSLRELELGREIEEYRSTRLD
jgi:hypothetical protein